MQNYTQKDLNTLQRYIQMSKAYQQLKVFPKQIDDLNFKLAKAVSLDDKTSLQEQLNATQAAYQNFQSTVQQTFPDMHPTDFPERMQQIEQQYFADLQKEHSKQPYADTLPNQAHAAMIHEKLERYDEMYRQREAELKLQHQQEREQRQLQAQKDWLWEQQQHREKEAPLEQKIAEGKDRLIQVAPPDMLDEMAYETQKKMIETNEKLSYHPNNSPERDELIKTLYDEGTRLDKIHQRIKQLEQQQEKDREEQSHDR